MAFCAPKRFELLPLCSNPRAIDRDAHTAPGLFQIPFLPYLWSASGLQMYGTTAERAQSKGIQAVQGSSIPGKFTRGFDCDNGSCG